MARGPKASALVPEVTTFGQGSIAVAARGPEDRPWRLYLDALRHMHPRQLAHRPRRLLPPSVLALGLEPAGAPSFAPIAGGLGAEAAPQSGPTTPPHEEGTFFAVGRKRRFGYRATGAGPGFWRDPTDGLLFLFHLHGFGPLATYAAGERTPAGDRFWAEVLESWLASEGEPRRPAWHTYPTSARVVAWAAALSSVETWSEVLRTRLVQSLLRQARYVGRTIEHDIGGNHVLKNAKALVVAGACFPASSLLQAGLRLLEDEVGRQVLADGGHEERSTSYHREVAHDLSEISELLERTNATPPAWLASARSRMDRWQARLTGPDGRLPLLNDAWEGPPLAAGADPASVHELSASGYTVLRDRNHQVIFDAGPISPPHLPPHAHADVLSFVLWADGSPVVVDPGAYAYTGPQRRAFRSTAAHNTVEVAGRDQCELWGDFRAAFPPRVCSLAVVRRPDGVLVARGRHDGYRRLSDPVVPQRALVLVPGVGIVVIDLLHGGGPKPVRSFLHLAPQLRCEGPRQVGPFALAVLGDGADLHLTPGAYAPFLGTRVEATVVEQERFAVPEKPFGWSLLRGEGEVTTLERDRLVVAAGDRPALEIPLRWD